MKVIIFILFHWEINWGFSTMCIVTPILEHSITANITPILEQSIPAILTLILELSITAILTPTLRYYIPVVFTSILEHSIPAILTSILEHYIPTIFTAILEPSISAIVTPILEHYITLHEKCMHNLIAKPLRALVGNPSSKICIKGLVNLRIFEPCFFLFFSQRTIFATIVP